MAVRIRLKKLGRRHRPYYRICVMDARTPRDGKSIEEIGTYDPMVRNTDARVTIKPDRVEYWLSVGAQPTEKVQILIDKYKGKVPAVRVDSPKQRVIPEIRVQPRKPRAPEAPPAPEAAAPVEEAAAPQAPEAPAAPVAESQGEAAPAE